MLLYIEPEIENVLCAFALQEKAVSMDVLAGYS